MIALDRPGGQDLRETEFPEDAEKTTSVPDLAVAAAIGAGVGVGVARFSRFVDLALIGSGFGAAVGAATFAGLMLMQGDHTPAINGMQYLAIFAQPGHAPRPEAPPLQVAAAPEPTPTPSVDMAPTGAIQPRAALASGDYELIAANAERAWVRAGPRIIAVHPGDDVPRLGKVLAIASNGGRWWLIGENGQLLLSSGEAAAPTAKGAAAMAQKRMIFGPGP